MGRNLHIKGFAAALAGATVGMMSTTTYADFDFLFDYDVTSLPSDVGPAGVVPLVNAANPGAAGFLADLIADGKPASVKVTSLPSDMSLFDNDDVVIENIFLDFETVGAEADKNTFLANLAVTASVSANVGNFRYEPAFPDSTIAEPFSDLAPSVFDGLNIANPQAYPGAPDQRNPASGNSTAPNIRSALFTMPIQRVSEVTGALDEGESNVPYVARFNNWNNDDLDTAGGGAPYEFETVDQLLSRGDFSAQVAHYTARGASSVVLFQPGVVGYTNDEQRDDALAGWKFFDDVTDGEGVTLTNRISVDGTTETIERAGAVWSGVANTDVLKVLISNLSESSVETDGALPTKTVNLPFAINGNIVSVRDHDVAPGTHLLATYSRDGFSWVLDSAEEVFADSDRSGVGVPEPASLAMLLMGAGLVGVRRRSTK